VGDCREVHLVAAVATDQVRRDRALLGPILVVDDDDLFRELVTTILKRAGYRAVEAATGEEALEVAEREPPAVVVLDVHLPGISGHEVCERLCAGDDGPPVLFVSGERTESYDRVAGLLVGGDDYLVKPLAPDELLARVRALIRRVREVTPTGLTSDERDLVRLLRQGLAAGEIARCLGETPNTVCDRIDDVLTKLGG
jgi:DNA-binding response OmpR family regulator